jgi:hypothetical protein
MRRTPMLVSALLAHGQNLSSGRPSAEWSRQRDPDMRDTRDSYAQGDDCQASCPSSESQEGSGISTDRESAATFGS